MAKITIPNNRYTATPLYQWDKNQTLEIYGLSLPSAPEIHFTNSAMDGALVRQATMSSAGVIRVGVPNSLLQKPYKITAYICVYSGSEFASRYEVAIPVKARPKPADYTLEVTDEEVYSFTSLENLANNALAKANANATEITKLKSSVNELSTKVESFNGENLPTVTSEDEGKFLKVVNGAWSVADIATYEGETEDVE